MVEKILNHRKKGKGIEYLVRWEDFDSSFDTWEPPSSFPKNNSVLKEYKKSHKLI